MEWGPIFFRVEKPFVPIIRKEVLAPGVVFVEDRDGNPVPVEFTAKHIDHFLQSGRKMLRCGLSVPTPVEHQNVKPLTEADRRAGQVLNNAGFVKDYVRLNGRLFADLDVADPVLAAKLGREVKYVSPEIEPRFVDGKGRIWTNVITHVAFTNRPRYMDQEAFRDAGTDGAALGAAFSLSLAKRAGGAKPVAFDQFGGAVRMSLAASVKRQGDGWRLADPAALANSARIRLSAGENNVADDKKPDDDEAPETAVETETPEAPAASGDLSTVMEMLAGCGIKVADDTTPANFIERLKGALVAYEHAKAHHGIDDGKADPDPDAPAGSADDSAAITEEPHGMLMSLAKAKTPSERVALRMATNERKARIERLKKAGHVDKKTHEELLSELDGARFSLSKDDELVWSADRWLERLERRPAVTDDMLKARLSQAREEPKPKDPGEADAEETKKTSDLMVADVDRV